MKQTKVNSPISFELWIAILLTVEQTNTSLSDLKISNNEKTKINQYHKIMIEMPQVSSKEQLKLFVYDYGINNIIDIIAINSILEDNNIKIASPLIFNLQSIKEIDQHLPIRSRRELNINGGDILRITSKKWSLVKEVLRQIEIDVLTNKVPNLKDELLKWVKENVKI